jgi:hypothetical protein
MQTFLPYPEFERTAQVLDNKRLGKQRLEALECLYLITDMPLYTIFPNLNKANSVTGKRTPIPNEKTRHYNHPCRWQWQGYPGYLALYGEAICLEWIDRGFEDNQLPRFQELINMLGLYRNKGYMERPTWLGDPAYHRSHQASLVSKLPSLYSADFPDVEPDDTLIWPVGKTKERGWMDGDI